MFRIVWFLTLIAGLGHSLAHAAPTPLHLGDASQVNLTPYLQVLEDKSAQLTLADVMLATREVEFHNPQSSNDSLNLSFSESAIWVRVDLRNDTGTDKERVLVLGFSRLSEVEFHVPGAPGLFQHVRTGNILPLATRPIKSRHFAVPVTVRAHAQQSVYVRIQSSSPLIIPLKLWTPQAFTDHENTVHIQQAVYYGMVLAMVIFNLLLFLSLRDVVYLAYVLFVALVAFAIGIRTGLTKEFLPINSALWWMTSSYITNSLTFAAFLFFMRSMLSTRTSHPRMDLGIKALITLHLGLPLVFVAYFQHIVVAAIWIYLVTLVVTMGMLVCAALQRQRSAYFLLAAVAVLFLTTLLNGVTSLGYLPANPITGNFLQLGSIMEMFLLAFAVADRFNLIRRGKVLAQKQALAAQSQLVLSLQESERLLEARVQERTEALQAANQQLETLSITDALTGLANRRRFDTILLQEWNRAQRTGHSLALAMIDVDWFKLYNDHYGHLQGDACLRQVAQTLQNCGLRVSDLAARYGGEEFAVIMPVTDDAHALAVATRICEAIAQVQMPHAKSTFQTVTVSIGVASLSPQQGGSPDELIQTADRALYEAKHSGRNRAQGASLPGGG